MCATRGLFVNVALMFGILYPERDLNPQFLFRKLDFKSSVYTIPPPGYLKSGRDSNPWPFGSFPPNEVPTLPPDLPEKLMVTLTIFSLSEPLPFFHFFWEISPISVVNLVLNRTILSFKVKKLLTTYLFPLIFLNIKKQTHKLSSQKTTRASDWIRTNVTFRFLITNQVQSTSMRRKPVAEYFFKVEVNSVS